MNDAVTKLVSCPPFGDHTLECELGDNTLEEVSKEVELIASTWSALWPKLKSHVSQLLTKWERPNYFQSLGFRMSIQKSGGWVEDDFFIELKFDGIDAFWCVFFKDLEVIHVQPSF